MSESFAGRSINDSGKIITESHEGVTTRLEVYSDAIFSIIATITILPAMEELRDEGSETNIEDILNYLLLYLLTYHFIIFFYREHNFKFNRLLYFGLDDVIINSIFLVGLGLFPFSNILIFEASKEFADSDDPRGLAIRVMFQGFIVIVVAFINMWITFWVEWKTKFERRTAMGYIRIVKDEESFWNIVIGAIGKFIGYFLTALIVIMLAMFGLGQYALLAYSFGPFIFWVERKLEYVLDFYMTQKFEEVEKTKSHMKKKLKESMFSQKERCLAFGDGIFAISATIIAVNLRPDWEEGMTVLEGFRIMAPQFISYFISFLILAFFWYLNGKMFDPLHEKVPFWVHYINTQFLFWVGALPAAAELLAVEFGTDEAYLANAIYGSILILAMLFEGICWIKILRLPEKYRHHLKTREKVVITIGLIIAPIISVPSIILTFFPSCPWCQLLGSLNFLVVPFAALLLYAIFAKKVQHSIKKIESENAVLF